ncbi:MULTISPECIES: S1/P1 nuclease [unclassified Nitrospina]|uniref:S1/P1 nuclease n=1 Tax=unclassified Nitrospina TaxID=2638683 RepID=UPI003F9B680F
MNRFNGTGWLGLFTGILLTVAGMAAPGWAWGPEGHRIVAHLAELRLEPDVRNTIQREFNIKHLASIANWADYIKKKPGAPDLLHYTNIAEGEREYLQSRDCPRRNCVTEKIGEYRGILADRTRPQDERDEALRFLVHLVADVHQPMHVGNARDRGGNEIDVRTGNRHTNLHALWDSGLIALGGRSLLQYARLLNQGLTPQEAALWGGGDPVAWTNESRNLVLHHGYTLSKDREGRLTRRYLEKGREVVAMQLKKAGVRLANLLNQILQ